MQKKNLVFLIILFIQSISFSFAQVTTVTISGNVKNQADKTAIYYADVVVKNDIDKSFVAGTVTNEEGRFSIENIEPGNYHLVISLMDFETKEQPLFIGSLSAFLDIPVIELIEQSTVLQGVTIIYGKS